MKKILFIIFPIVTYWNTTIAQTGAAIDLDGVNDYISIGTQLTANSSYTKEAWVYATNIGGNRNIISSLNNPFWISGNTLRAGNNGTYSVVVDAVTFPVSTWTHVAVTYDAGTTTMKLYKNGALVSTNTSAPVYTSQNELIGSHNTGSLFVGKIDEVRIWSRALSLGEIQGSMACGIATTGTNLVSNYHFSQGTAGGTNTGITSLTDDSGNGNNGTLTNFALSGSSSNWVAPGATNPGASGTDTKSACTSYTWIDGNTYTANNNSATHTLTSFWGCDSVVTLNLTIKSTSTGTDTKSACTSYTWIDGNTYTANNNSATHTLTNAAGCDSVVTLNLTIKNATSGTDTKSACTSYTWIDGNTYTANNNSATHTLTNAAGCDSVVTLNLTIKNATSGTDTKSACTSYTWIDGNTYTANNNSATHTLTNAAGCDSVVTLNLTIKSTSTGTDTKSACTSYTWIDGNTYTANNNSATHTLTNAAGCDSVVTLNLTIKSTSTGTDTKSACTSYTWIDGNTYTANNNSATHTLTNAAGCDSVVTLNLTIKNATSGTDVKSACTSYTWIDGNTYTANNNSATHTLTNAAGCDSVATLNLTIKNATSGTDTKSACTSYTWIDGNTYTANNNSATHTLTNAAGCDSVVTLNLTIKNATSGTDTKSACTSYTWIDGNTYTANNNSATHTLTNAAGCDSVVTLNLTIKNATSSTDTKSACTSYTWIDGNTYTSNNNSATHTLTNAAGCDSVVTLNLTIKNATSSTDTKSACTSYTWIDGNTYTANNNSATHTLTNAAGCDSVVTLNLTIKDATSGTDTKSACTSYTWIDGNTYTADNNSATHTLTNAAGCDSVVTLNLTIKDATSGTDTKSACTSYTWIDGNTYTANNNSATHTLTNAAGCDSVVTLNLTIKNATSSTDTKSACTSYTWIDGNTYTANNNSATHTLTNAAGCDSVVTLNLTIKNATSGTDVKSACTSYTWIDGNTYTANNNSATHTLTNAAGCDSVVTLNLTIKNATSSTDVKSACTSYTWIDGNTYTANNNSATHTLTNAAGCDSVVTLNLTITNIDITTSTSGNIITANENGATYKWIDCNNSNQLIAGEINQSFTATASGDYAVIITVGACSDTSNCINIITTGKNENVIEHIKLYPNPTSDYIIVDIENNRDIVNYTITSIDGKIVAEGKTIEKIIKLDLTEENKGFYFLTIKQNGSIINYKIIKQ